MVFIICFCSNGSNTVYVIRNIGYEIFFNSRRNVALCVFFFTFFYITTTNICIVFFLAGHHFHLFAEDRRSEEHQLEGYVFCTSSIISQYSFHCSVYSFRVI